MLFSCENYYLQSQYAYSCVLNSYTVNIYPSISNIMPITCFHNGCNITVSPEDL